MKNSEFQYSKLDEIAYIRQPEIIELFDKYLFDNDRMRIIEGDLTTANHIINLYCKTVKKFPLISGAKLSEKDIIIARKWITENKGKYEMNRGTF